MGVDIVPPTGRNVILRPERRDPTEVGTAVSHLETIRLGVVHLLVVLLCFPPLKPRFGGAFSFGCGPAQLAGHMLDDVVTRSARFRVRDHGNFVQEAATAVKRSSIRLLPVGRKHKPTVHGV
jgi:hypothetical protein